MNDQSKRNRRLKYRVDLNMSLTDAKFLNIAFLQEFFNLNKKTYRIFYLECKKSHRTFELSINVNLNFLYKKLNLLFVIDQI